MSAGKICMCRGCGKSAVPGRARCVRHQAEWEAERGTRQQRGYGALHDRTRTRLLLAWATAVRRGETWHCPRCGNPLIPGEPVDADHFGQTLLENPAAEADALSHERCNRGARPGLRNT